MGILDSLFYVELHVVRNIYSSLVVEDSNVIFQHYFSHITSS